MVKMVSTLLSAKPSDPVPHIYSFLKEAQKGIPLKDIKPITENELNEQRNLKKKIDYCKDLLGEGNQSDPVTSEEDDESDNEVEEIQPKKKNIKKQR